MHEDKLQKMQNGNCGHKSICIYIGYLLYILFLLLWPWGMRKQSKCKLLLSFFLFIYLILCYWRTSTMIRKQAKPPLKCEWVRIELKKVFSEHVPKYSFWKQAKRVRQIIIKYFLGDILGINKPRRVKIPLLIQVW